MTNELSPQIPETNCRSQKLKGVYNKKEEKAGLFNRLLDEISLWRFFPQRST